MPSTRRVKVLAVALAIAFCTILYLSVRLTLLLFQLYITLGWGEVLICMLACSDRLLVPRFLQSHSFRP